MRPALKCPCAHRPATAALIGLLAWHYPALGQSSQEPTPPPPQPGQVQPPGAPPPALQIPNTQSAPPFTVRDKFDYRVVQSFGFRGFVGAAIGSAIGQADNSPKEWGQGVGGFAERYGSGFAGNASRQTFAWVLESAFREDPRYFASEDKNGKQRVLNALKQVTVAARISTSSSPPLEPASNNSCLSMRSANDG
jgi:hypothetical protein